MSILKILQYPDSRLRRKANQVTDVTSAHIQNIINNMVETLLNTKDCAALAATQLDIEEPPHIVVINHTKNSNSKDILCLINAKILTKEGSSFHEEGCMSIYPHEISAKIKRATKIKVTTLDLNNNRLEFEATDYFARCIQHELDHLKGILYIDHLSKAKRSLLAKKIAKLN